MPNAVLSAVVFLIGVRLIDVKGMRDIADVRPGEFAVAVLTAATVVAVGVEQGIILAIIASIVVHIAHSYRPYDTLIEVTEAGHIKSMPRTAGTQARPGLAIYRFGASLYYANATRFQAEVMEIVDAADPKLEWLGFAASAVGDVDYSGADSIRLIQQELARQGITFAVIDLSPNVRTLFDKYGLTEVVGKENIYEGIPDVIEAFLARRGPSATSSAAPTDPPPPPATPPTAAQPTPPTSS
jgi:MFS superfamily sulfate permease-like transporter